MIRGVSREGSGWVQLAECCFVLKVGGVMLALKLQAASPSRAVVRMRRRRVVMVLFILRVVFW